MSNLLRGQLSTILLSCLMNGDKYGSELLDDIKNKTDGQLIIKQPTLYSTLTRMEKLGHISSYWLDSEIGGKRHYYSLTDLGQKVLQSSNDIIWSDFSQNNDDKNAENRINSDDAPKYDEIGDISKIDEGLLIKNPPNENSTSTTSLISKKSVAIELEKLHSQKNSFAENLKNSNNTEKNDAVFLEPNKKIPTYEKNDQTQNDEIIIEKTEQEDNVKKDDGIFITEKIPSDIVPKVKKLDSNTNFKIDNQSPIIQKLNFEATQNNTEDAIQKLYNITKVKTGKKIVSNAVTPIVEQTPSSTLDDKNENSQTEIVEEKTISYNSLFKKHLMILTLVTIESLAIWLIFTLINGAIAYALCYLFVPIIFAIPPLYYFISKKNKIVNRSSSMLFYIVSFILTVILLFSVNMLWGMDFTNILLFPTTFIYPCVLSTNILVYGIINKKLTK